MPISEYIAGLRALVGTKLILVPGVTAVVLDDAGRILMGRHADTDRWSTIGGAIELDEAPVDAVYREVREELGVEVAEAELLGAYGGPRHRAIYPNGDRAAFVTVAYLVTLASHDFTFPDGEILESRWVALDELDELSLYDWIADLIPDLRARLDAT